MTAVDLKDLTVTVPARAAQDTHQPVEWPSLWTGIVIGGVLGIISGLAEGNSLVTGNGHFVELLFWSVTGTVIGSGLGAAIGGAIDVVVARAKRTAR
jgi:hypothetical protein